MTQIVKRISDPYFITSANLAVSTSVIIGDVIANSAEVTINGNLVVTGTQTTINTTDLAITDNIIILNDGETGAGVTANVSGIEVNRGTLANVSVLWSESNLKWQLTNDGSTFANIATIGAGGSYISAVVEDISPELGGNLVTNGFEITSNVNTNLVLTPDVYLQIDGPIQLEHVTPPPANIPGYTLIHGGTVAGGETGVYVTNELVANREIITDRKSIVYSLIF